MKLKEYLYILLTILLVNSIFGFLLMRHLDKQSNDLANNQTQNKQVRSNKDKSNLDSDSDSSSVLTKKDTSKVNKIKQNEDKSSKIDENIDKSSTIRKQIDWQKSSETKPYPNLKNVSNFWIKVSLKKNRTYLMSGDKVIYTMYSSGGSFYHNKETGKYESYTPTGTFYIEPERGESFYNPSLKEGANNWVSFKDHGVYLFHSVPTDSHGSYNIEEAKKLGKEPASHGCIRLSVPDSKWMPENLQVGTKVVIEN